MALSSESERILEQAVAGIPRIAQVIADFPVELREGALELAERRYQQTVCDLGYAEADAQGWISVVMFRLRRKVAEFNTKKLEGGGSALADQPRQDFAVGSRPVGAASSTLTTWMRET
jgi:hypothetical protein